LSSVKLGLDTFGDDARASRTALGGRGRAGLASGAEAAPRRCLASDAGSRRGLANGSRATALGAFAAPSDRALAVPLVDGPPTRGAELTSDDGAGAPAARAPLTGPAASQSPCGALRRPVENGGSSSSQEGLMCAAI